MLACSINFIIEKRIFYKNREFSHQEFISTSEAITQTVERFQDDLISILNRYIKEQVQLHLNQNVLLSLSKKKLNRIAWTDETIRFTIHQFLSSLPAEDTWMTKTLLEWGTPENPTLGSLLYALLKDRASKTKTNWYQVLVSFLDENDLALLKQKPFSQRKSEKMKGAKKWPIAEIKSTFKDFLSSLAPQSSWSFETLARWGSHDDPRKGKRLASVLVNNGKKLNPPKSWYEYLFEVLSADERVLLQHYPYTQAVVGWNDIKAKEIFKEFLSTKASSKWGPEELKNWGTLKDPKLGRKLFHYLYRQALVMGMEWEAYLSKLLNHDDQEFFKSTYKKLQHRIRNFENIRHEFNEFLSDWPKKSWSGIDLRLWKTKDDSKWGQNLFCALIQQKGDKSWYQYLYSTLDDTGKELLKVKPYVPKKGSISFLNEKFQMFFEWLIKNKRKVWSVRDIEKFDKSFLTLLYNRKDLRESDGSIDWLYILIKVVGPEFNMKFPFNYRGQDLVDVRSSPASSSKEERKRYGDTEFNPVDIIPEKITPEDMALTVEREIYIEALPSAISKLSPSERVAVRSYMKGDLETIDPHLLEKLRDILGLGDLD